MRIVPALYGFLETRLASPFWRRLLHLFERGRELRMRLRARPQGADPLAGRFCPRPFDSFELQESGSVYLCCPSWLPTRAGNLHTASAEAVWNSETAQAVRASIHDGSFRYCDRAVCPDIQAGSLPTRAELADHPRYGAIIRERATRIEGVPAFINLANDKSCNLSCPSCRTKRIQINDGPEYAARAALQQKLVQSFLTRPTDQPFAINITGSGDPFASHLFREFLFGFDAAPFPRLQVNLQTNGVLFTEKVWASLGKLHGHVGNVLVSLDAASEATYRVTRRGGDWRQLMENLDFLARLRRENKIRELNLFFVVQKANFREIPDYVRIGLRAGADRIGLQKAANWGTWSGSEYRDQCVWKSAHPLYREFARVMADPVLDHPSVFLGNLTEERRTALDAGTRLEAAPA